MATFGRKILRFVLILFFIVAGIYTAYQAIKYQKYKSIEQDIDNILPDTLRVAMVADLQNEDTLYSAFHLSMLDYLTDTLHIPYLIYPYSSTHDCLKAVNKHVCNMAMALTPLTTEVRNNHAMTHDIIEGTPRLLQLKSDKTPKSILDIDSTTLYIEYKSPYIPQLKHLVEESGLQISIVDLDCGNDSLVHLLLNGDIKYLVTDDITAQEIMYRHSELTRTLKLGISQPMGWSVEREREVLRYMIDCWIDKFKLSGDFADEYNKIKPERTKKHKRK